LSRTFRAIRTEENSHERTDEPLRRRVIDDMTIRNMSLCTRKVYVAAVANFSAFHGRSPNRLTIAHVREYQLHLVARGLKAASINPILAALRFFYRTTLGQKEVADQIASARKADTLPAVLAKDEVTRFLKAVPDLTMRTVFIAIYAAGLRVSEAVNLTIGDIDSARMVIHVRQGKGGKDRYVMLSEQLLAICAPIGSRRAGRWRCAPSSERGQGKRRRSPFPSRGRGARPDGASRGPAWRRPCRRWQGSFIAPGRHRRRDRKGGRRQHGVLAYTTGVDEARLAIAEALVAQAAPWAAASCPVRTWPLQSRRGADARANAL
jgi:hypothetical protein